ncbi:MAG: asparaginase [Rhodothermales bacterium]|nr:asparaginase [Rhodothermales bacterium]
MHIKIISTGGTIDKIYFDAKSNYTVGDPLIGEILAHAGVNFTFDVEKLMAKDSLELTNEDRRLIVDRVGSDPCPRIIVTHGTDTMIDTARALEAVEGKTIVLVGSLSPARFKGTDAEFNIGFAVAAVQTLPHGSYVAMQGRAYRPDEVRKNVEANRFEEIEK